MYQPARRKLTPSSKGLPFGRFQDFQGVGELPKRLDSLVKAGSLEYTDTGKLRPVMVPSAVGIPRVVYGDDGSKCCELWYEICFKQLGILPFPCHECWKVVILPFPVPEGQEVLDLFKLDRFLAQRGLFSKCGVDIRHYTPNRYCGFIYTSGRRQGLEVRDRVREELGEILPNASVILKRACTEYELAFGDSGRWVITHEQAAFENQLYELMEPARIVHMPGMQELGRAYTKRFWIEYAYGIGDTSWREALIFAGYEDPGPWLFAPSRTYEHDTLETQRETEQTDGCLRCDCSTGCTPHREDLP